MASLNLIFFVFKLKLVYVYVLFIINTEHILLNSETSVNFLLKQYEEQKDEKHRQFNILHDGKLDNLLGYDICFLLVCDE